MSGINKETLKHDPFAEKVFEIAAKLKLHWKPIAITAFIAFLVVSLVVNLYIHKKNLPLEASDMLAIASTPPGLLEVAKQYPETFAAQAALMQLASIEAQQTNYGKAIMYFKLLINDHPDSFLVPAANYAVVKCYVGQRNYKEAEQILKRNLLYNQDHYAALAAQIELVNVLNAMGRYDEALKEIMQLEQVLGREYSSTIFGGLAERLMRLTGATTNIQQQAYENTTAEK